MPDEWDTQRPRWAVECEGASDGFYGLTREDADLFATALNARDFPAGAAGGEWDWAWAHFNNRVRGLTDHYGPFTNADWQAACALHAGLAALTARVAELERERAGARQAMLDAAALEDDPLAFLMLREVRQPQAGKSRCCGTWELTEPAIVISVRERDRITTRLAALERELAEARERNEQQEVTARESMDAARSWEREADAARATVAELERERDEQAAALAAGKEGT